MAEAAAVVVQQQEVTKLPWTEPSLMELDKFARLYSKYPHCIVTIYQIIRDLHIKQEVIELKIIDGSSWGRNEYFIEGRTRATKGMRLMVPFYLDEEIDLPWLRKIAIACEGKGEELYLCIHTPESIIYEMVTTELP